MPCWLMVCWLVVWLQVCEERDPPFPRKDEGRFHHIAWKADHKSTCTTQVSC